LSKIIIKILYSFENSLFNIIFSFQKEMNKYLLSIIFSNFKGTHLLNIKYINNSLFHKCYLKYRKVCSLCNTHVNLRICLCLKIFCQNCLDKELNKSCHEDCYILSSETTHATNNYNISKHFLPNNFELKINYSHVHWIRTGITFDQKILKLGSEDLNKVNYDVYYILEDLLQFYTFADGWYNLESQDDILPLNNNDYLTVRMNNGIMLFKHNEIQLSHKIEVNDKMRKCNLFLHNRKCKSSARVIYILDLDAEEEI
jgi:hypothetical protein